LLCLGLVVVAVASLDGDREMLFLGFIWFIGCRCCLYWRSRLFIWEMGDGLVSVLLHWDSNQRLYPNCPILPAFVRVNRKWNTLQNVIL